MSKSTTSQLNFVQAKHEGPIECLGMAFQTDEARRTYFLEKLREKLKDPRFRKIEGFPIGDDENILALSDPPYYTACPNPFVDDFIRFYGKGGGDGIDSYHREPFAADVSEGKNDPIYNAHSYHTKVPYKAIMRYILHYTDPGDIVLDGFCGTGMTGIAAQFCGDKVTVESLGYAVDHSSSNITDGMGNQVSRLGARLSILNDLSPAATFIAYNYQVAVDFETFSSHATRILKEVEDELGWMYSTTHSDGKTKGKINFIVWSELFNCPDCSGEVVFVKEALDRSANSVRDDFPCPHCGTTLTLGRLELVFETKIDTATSEPIKCPKRIPVFVNYSIGTKKYEKEPDKSDLELCDQITRLPIPSAVPTDMLPDMQMTRVGRIKTISLSHVHHFFFPRTAQILGALWQRASSVRDHRIRSLLLFLLESQLVNLSLRNRYRPGVSFPYNPLTGVFYVPAMVSEASVFTAYKNKLKRIATAFEGYTPISELSRIETRAASGISIPDSCVDYIFTDPPFGENIYYSDLNFFIEAWLRVFTNTTLEAIVDRVKGKTLLDYQRMMSDCFRNYCRVLKPGRWMTVEFHNSRNSVWNAIQEALEHAGFVVADVRTLDKQQGSFQQVVSGNTVKRDLIISAYKPNGGLEERFKQKAGSEDGAWEFLSTHLKQLPIFVEKNGRSETIAERQGYILYDRMVAFHVQRGYPVPLSSPEFHAGVRQRFPERDGMYFLSEQVTEYDRKRLEVKDVEQLELFVSDEKSAIQWVRQQLSEKPMHYQDLQPLFMKEAQRVWEKHEQPIELRTILEQGFVEDERGKWCVADPKKDADLDQIRERVLIKEFNQYTDTKGKLKIVRTEALRAGFKNCWQKKDYPSIVAMAKRVPEAVIQEDSALLMYFDNASLMLGE